MHGGSGRGPSAPPRSTPIGRRVPLPHGLLSGRRKPWRRLVARALAYFDRTIGVLPPGRWVHDLALRRLEYTEVDVPLRRGGTGLDGMRIAFVSDVHAGFCIDEARLCEIFEAIAARAPDLVCLGGDLINTRDREILLYRKPLALLRPPLGVIAVPGNHDHFHGDDLGLWAPFLRDQGVHVLINSGVRVRRGDASLWIAGVDDLTEGRPDLGAALAGRGDDEATLLLSHHPDYFFEAAAVDVDLTLSGHTHGGQVLFFGWTPLNHSKFGWWRGRYEENDCQLYVGRGVGTTLLPVRFGKGTEPEVPILRLRVASAHR